MTAAGGRDHVAALLRISADDAVEHSHRLSAGAAANFIESLPCSHKYHVGSGADRRGRVGFGGSFEPCPAPSPGPLNKEG